MSAEPISTVDPVAVFRTILLENAVGTELAELVVRGEHELGDAPPFVLLGEAGSFPHRSIPVHYPARVTVSAFGATGAAAAQLLRQVSALMHRAGPRLVGTAGVWKVFNETGVQRPLRDPESGWWLAAAVFDVYMTDRAIGA